MLKIGDKAPAISLISNTGEKVALKDFLGKKVVIYFYPKDSTPGCTTEACDFRDNFARIKKKAMVLGISRDSIESHQKFVTKYKLNFPLLVDDEGKACEAYGVWQEKSLYGRKFMGIVRSTFIVNEKGRIEHIFPKVKVKGHVDEVLKLL